MSIHRNSSLIAQLAVLMHGFVFAGAVAAHECTLPSYLARLAVGPSPLVQADNTRTCSLTIQLVDSETGENLPGLVRVATAGNDVLAVPQLFNRGVGLKNDHKACEWHVLLDATRIEVPQAPLHIEAFSGLETETTRVDLNLSGKSNAELSLPLTRFYRASDRNLVSGNTHLHLNRLTAEECDRYLQCIPQADDLDVTFVSYLTRHEADKTYISNRYTSSSLRALSSPRSLLAWGEEHRHNFSSHAEGYGHVMLLGIPELIHPVSIGPGIMDKSQTDGIPLQRAIRQTRKVGGTSIWCHNQFGMEDMPNWVAGLLDAQNIFDGGSRGDYADTFYRYLNLGLYVPFSAGTDWFMYDFSRVYVEVSESLTEERWLEALSQGRSIISNETFLELEVDGNRPGDTIQLDAPRELKVVGRGIGRNNFSGLELVHNGRVIHSGPSRAEEGHYRAEIEYTVRMEKPGWLALRIPGSGTNEFGRALFAHTSPVIVELNGKRIYRPEVRDEFLAQLEQNIESIRTNGMFASEEELERVLRVYRDARETLKAMPGTAQ